MIEEFKGRIARQLNNHTILPEWMTVGRTILCQKDLLKETEVNNLRPISCLPFMWKLLASIFGKNYEYI